MRRGRRVLPAAVVLCAGLSACGADERGSAEREKAPAGPQLGQPVTVSGQANVFGAGHPEPPDPGSGGPGVPPTMLRLAKGSDRVVTFRRVKGRVNPIRGETPWNGAGGDGRGPTSVNSWEGISGIVHRRNGMFLVGVFLDDKRPRDPAPPRLSFTGREEFRTLAPRLSQTFFVGDGAGRSYRVPRSATRLFMGFADAYAYIGNPGWYGNNGGKLSVTVELTRR